MRLSILEVLAEHTEAVVSCIDRERRFVYVNRGITRPAAFVLGRRVDDFMPDDERDRIVGIFERAFASGEPDEYRVTAQLPDGSSRLFRNRVLPMRSAGGIRHVLAISQDETRLRDSEERYRHLAESLPDFAITVDREYRYRWVNRLAPGLAPEDVLGERIHKFLAPDAVQLACAVIDRVFETGEAGSYEAEGYRDADTRAWYQTRVVPAVPDGDVEQVLVLTSDVTERKHAEFALRDSEARFRALTEHSPDLILVVDEERRVVFSNRAFADSADAALGKHLSELIDAVQPQEADLALGATLREGKAATFEASDLSGDTLYHARAVPLPSEDTGLRALIVLRDVTRERRDEKARDELRLKLQRAQRLESLGMLAGGVAHDFNNLLQVIQTNLLFAARHISSGQDAGEDLDEAKRASERAAELTAQLLAFARRQPMDVRPGDVGILIDASIKMLRRIIPASIEIDFRQSSQSCVAAVDMSQLEQVVFNLCLNARDSMPDGGTLTIETRTVARDGGQDYVEIAIRDTGAGIPEHLRARIFEPFFSTKGPGKGTGLGLAVADGIIQSLGGTLSLSSEEGQGSEFVIRLPRASLPAVGVVEEQASMVTTGVGTILLAEDEPSVRKLTSAILRDAGYRVLEAVDGVEAVAVFVEHSAEIDLALIDVVMPRMNGWDVYQRLVAERPNVRVLFTSGYSAGALPDDLSSSGIVGLVNKPFTAETLLGSVQEGLRQVEADRRRPA